MPQKKRKSRRVRLPYGAGSVHLIGDGKNRSKPWRARVAGNATVDYETGKVKQHYIQIGCFATEAEAIEALYNYKRDPYTMEASTCTFADIYAMWSKEKFPTISKSACRGYAAAYKNSVLLHECKMRELRSRDFEKVMQDVAFGFASQNSLKKLWNQLYGYAIKHDICTKNYSKFVYTRDPEPETTRHPFSQEDIAKLWSAIDAGEQFAEILMIYIYTGFRANELLSLEKSAVDLEARIMVGGSKTAAGKNRRVPFHKCILPIIERYMAEPGENLIMRSTPRGPVPFTYNALTMRKWIPFLQRWGLDESYTPHYARHTFATMLREANVPDDIAKLILGHASKDITDRYTHRPDSTLVEAIDKLPGRI